MCGIIGYVGPQDAQQVIIDGLRRMEYRGYDSAGIAVVAGGRLSTAKKAGKLTNLEAVLASAPLPASNQGIGHTRWATHGAPTDVNAHPHVSNDGRVALVHNGIIENFAELRAELEAEGTTFVSETDTEVAAHLLARELRSVPLLEAMCALANRLRGAFTLVAVDAQDPEHVVAARRNSPLVVGVGNGENFLASDVLAFIAHTRDVIELGQDEAVLISRDEITVVNFDGTPAHTRRYHVDWDTSAAEKGGFDWFMRKEIFEQPQAIADTLLGRYNNRGELVLDEMRSISQEDLRRVNKIVIVACGTAYYAGMVAKYAIEHWTRVPCEVEVASEFRYRDPIIDPLTLCVTISQSGETADTLMAIRHARVQGAKVIAICNTNGATIPRESDAVIYTHAGPEIGVASTKGFLTQVAACYLLGLYLAQVRGMKYADEIRAVTDELGRTPQMIQQLLDNAQQVYDLARDLSSINDFIFLGRHVGYPVALEGALKLKEIAYQHAEGFAAGELKHGPIAIIEPGMPVFVIVPPQGRDQLHDKVVSNIQEVRARGARTIVLVEEDDADVEAYSNVIIRLPRVSTLLQPLVAAVPLQLFACELATLLGHDVDQPRNLAKSVTVE
ncbi:glutamine--fructose-6-phosphate transaminase (isomerizing) [Brooklawnia cerclae]|uniref:Glutamine--fructose-6-phosphate aminotransferase [isomerizing] n=1 Tax=Brooklawnia cerclae TaxID=349934 RepID=A0ABX0SBW9_9ACTN|nr:glutamine--fructose-6-phosphate transaminase (isomerizing) [Brooklawnia cerclae]NIH55878.1 glucosamine--fructose-6-phosphate aminotransferase (isomerizing) [Brooklawnia cerclae]